MNLQDCENGFYTDGKKVYEKDGVDIIEWWYQYENRWETDACVENIYNYNIEVKPFSFKSIDNGIAWT